jgi:hypothetical protein
MPLTISLRNNGGHCESRSRMAGRKAAPVRERPAVFEPGVAIVAVRRDLVGYQSSRGVLHHEAEELRIDERFCRKETGVARLSMVRR